jgi:uncharacterized surface protein with fasciclin (FAS1) repeats
MRLAIPDTSFLETRSDDNPPHHDGIPLLWRRLARLGAAAGGSAAAACSGAQILAEAGDFRSFNTAMERGSLKATMASPSPVTVFALPNAAEAKVPAAIRSLFLPANQNSNAGSDSEMAAALAGQLVVPGAYHIGDLRPGMELYTSNDATIHVLNSVNGQPVLRIAGFTVTISKPETPCSNGLLHTIEFIMPPGR